MFNLFKLNFIPAITKNTTQRYRHYVSYGDAPKDGFFTSFVKNHFINYPTPMNLTYMWSFGSLSAFCLIIQIISGLFLSMYYVPDMEHAFRSVQYIMRDVKYGWFIRYLYSNGASMFYIVLYIHEH